MSRAFTELFVHMVWGTFERAPWITEAIEKPLYAVMWNKCRECACDPIALGGTSDHVHILVAMSPTIAVATLVKEVKGASAYVAARGLSSTTSFRWQGGYGAFTLRKTDVPTVRNYVLHQKEHHASRTITTEWEATADHEKPMKKLDTKP